MKKLSVELAPWLATAVFVSSLAGCGSEAVGGDENNGSTATELPPTHLDPARRASLNAAVKAEAFESTPDDGNRRPITDEIMAQLDSELDAHSVEKLDRKTLKAGAAFSVAFRGDISTSGQFLANSSTHICYLQQIQSAITNPTNPEFSLTVENNGNIVAYKDVGPTAVVRCVPRDFFAATNGTKPFQNRYNYTFLWDECGAYQANSGFRGNVVEMIAGIGYDYTGWTDNFGIIQASSSSQFNQFRIQQNSGACRGVGFTAPVMFNKATVIFEGPGGVGTTSVAGEYSYSASPGASLDQTLTHGGTPVSEVDSECYFTYLGGRFAGAADLAWLRPVNNNWTLMLMGSSGGLSAKVRCVRHAQ